MIQTMENFVNIHLSSTNHDLKQVHPCGISNIKKTLTLSRYRKNI